ncbi:MAPEG family protein [Oceanobacter sp. 5_MG-2023]|uniref:MAPEG family protein n=1 Tax=Oceanobacter sp. 5_MG-2023 TaxID=3062645 RepID=UPI0026E2D14C|nr:MAPEG family protein [Oceanobacter sp. 5_MG-2023]MDO6682064.1 MAPEG family protein [Oceanobacter sp. 5_MG-2023]
MPELMTSYSLTFQALMLIFATLLVQNLVATMAHRKQGRYTPGIIDPQLSHGSFVFRSHRTFINSLENLPLLLGPALIGILSGFDALKLGVMCSIYAATRLIHMGLYYAIATERNPSPRSYFYMVGLLVSIVQLVMVLIHVLRLP